MFAYDASKTEKHQAYYIRKLFSMGSKGGDTCLLIQFIFVIVAFDEQDFQFN